MLKIKIEETCKPRVGTRCAVCGEPIGKAEAVHIAIPKQPRGVYVHASCNVAHRAGTFTPQWYTGGNERKATEAGKVATALQFKAKPHETETFPAYVYAASGVYVTPTSKDDACITWPRTVLNQHGTRDAVETIARAGDIIRYSVEAGCYNDEGDVYRPPMTISVYNALKDVEGVRAVEYRDNSLRVYADFTSVTAATWMVYLVQDILKLARDGKGERVQLAHIRAHVEGRAVWQRPERNKTER